MVKRLAKKQKQTWKKKRARKREKEKRARRREKVRKLEEKRDEFIKRKIGIESFVEFLDGIIADKTIDKRIRKEAELRRRLLSEFALYDAERTLRKIENKLKRLREKY